MTEAERHSAAIILLECIGQLAEQLSVNGGPTCHATAAKIQGICKAHQQRQLAFYDAAKIKEQA